MSQKGAAFERKICGQLSLWWSENKNDAIFWRTSQSGGRATTRRKKDKATFGQAGDIAAVDPVGLPFLELFAVELKRGYSKDTPFDVADRADRMRPQTFQQWVYQAVRSQEESKAAGWLIVFKRNGRREMACLPADLWRNVAQGTPYDASHIRWTEPSEEYSVIVMPLTTFLNELSPGAVLRFVARRRRA